MADQLKGMGSACSGGWMSYARMMYRAARSARCPRLELPLSDEWPDLGFVGMKTKLGAGGKCGPLISDGGLCVMVAHFSVCSAVDLGQLVTGRLMLDA
ncbi:hypothetical protein ACLOJK_027183 [Asimina triloba]